jgi:hypothetical protein
MPSWSPCVPTVHTGVKVDRNLDTEHDHPPVPTRGNQVRITIILDTVLL